MIAFYKNKTLVFSSAVLFLGAVQLTNLSVRKPEIARVGGKAIAAVMFPFERGFHEISASAEHIWYRYIWLVGLQEEVEGLRERLRSLESLNSRYVEYRHENSRLKELVNFSEASGHRGVAATVVSRNSSNWVNTLTIDKGSSHGVRPGLAVIDGNAVVGQTTVVSARSSKVLLLSDPASAIDAIVQSSRLSGIVEGGSDGKLRLRYVEQTPRDKVHPGDRIVASGLDGVFPKGVAVGVVHDVSSGSSALFQEIFIEPSTVLNRLETVLVLVPELHQEAVGLDVLFRRTQYDLSSHEVVPHCGRFAGE